ncbi:MAG TPA: NAD(P) transhydrogenase subunit alpha [Streptosporangiaceae bacterium]
MYPALLVDITIFVLSLWVGFEVISKVPATLHTPLMSAANSIHGIVLAGALLIAVTAHNPFGYVVAFIAAAFAAANVVGGYVVTGRMLKMFRKRPSPPVAPPPSAAVASGKGSAIAGPSNGGPNSAGPSRAGPGTGDRVPAVTGATDGNQAGGASGSAAGRQSA